VVTAVIGAIGGFLSLLGILYGYRGTIIPIVRKKCSGNALFVKYCSKHIESDHADTDDDDDDAPGKGDTAESKKEKEPKPGPKGRAKQDAKKDTRDVSKMPWVSNPLKSVSNPLKHFKKATTNRNSGSPYMYDQIQMVELLKSRKVLSAEAAKEAESQILLQSLHELREHGTISDTQFSEAIAISEATRVKEPTQVI